DDARKCTGECKIDRLRADVAADLQKYALLLQEAALAQDHQQPVDGLAFELPLPEDLSANIVRRRETHQMIACDDSHRRDPCSDIFDQQAAAEAGVEKAGRQRIACLAQTTFPIFRGKPCLAGHYCFSLSGSAAFSLG